MKRRKGKMSPERKLSICCANCHNSSQLSSLFFESGVILQEDESSNENISLKNGPKEGPVGIANVLKSHAF